VTFATQIEEALSPLSAVSVFDPNLVTAAQSWAQSFIESYCNRTFDLVENQTVLVDPHFGKALLPFTPVVSVSQVQGFIPDPTTGMMAFVTLTNFIVDNDTGLIYNSSGLPGVVNTVGRITWPWLPESLQVTYSHGFSKVPQQLVDVSVRLALQYLENPSLLMLRRVGDIEYRYSGSAGLVVNDLDRRILDRFSVVSVA
jgi:hypothetical protein